MVAVRDHLNPSRDRLNPSQGHLNRDRLNPSRGRLNRDLPNRGRLNPNRDLPGRSPDRRSLFSRPRNTFVPFCGLAAVVRRLCWYSSC